jgi:monovalent cation:H+ antiporter, CPA1 family
MELFHIFSWVLVLSALFAYVNFKFIKLPSTIGLMLLGLVMSMILLFLGNFFPELIPHAKVALEELDFSEILLEFMLSFLLFAGALHTDMYKLSEHKAAIFTFATLGVVVSAALVSVFAYYLLPLFGLEIPYIYCLLFGILISPTDPIAVMGILKKAGVPPKIEVKITGESLFNDGVGVVAFLTVFQIAQKGYEGVTGASIGTLLAEEILGGVLLGIVLGYGAVRLMKTIDHYQTEVLISLAVVVGGYSFASVMHFSGPLAMVIAGLFIGNKGKRVAMSDTTLEYLSKFWEMMDEIFNAVLFVLIGIELIVIPFTSPVIYSGLILAMLVVVARYIALLLPSSVMSFSKTFAPNTLSIMTWGGLRGGISIALALSLPPHMQKNEIVSLTYIVVLFSILVQGLTIERFIKRVSRG